jgi:hypothetical protein
MKRTSFALLLALAGAAHAALPRVVLEAPLAPVSAPLAAGAAGAALPASALLLAAPAAPSPALSPLAAPSPAAAPALAVLPAPSDGVPKPADGSPAANPRADSVEGAAAEAGRNFDASAPADHVYGGAVAPAGSVPSAHDALLSRLLTRVRLEDDGVLVQHLALVHTFERMLQSPTARGLAERFVEDGATAVVRFQRFEGSQIVEEDGRRIFRASRAFTEWKDGQAIVRLNADYLGTDETFQKQDLPPTLAHELLGHGLWYSRAARENVLQGFHHHELNEMNARAVGWRVDFELDRYFEESGAWSFIADPGGFLAYLKTRLPFYALTFSNEELSRPVQALEERSSAAKAKLAQQREELANHRTWNHVIDFFVRRRAVPEVRFRALRAQMAEQEAAHLNEIAMIESVIAEVEATLSRMRAEPDGASENYLRWAGSHPMFGDLQREYDENVRRLVEHVKETGARAYDEPAELTRRRAEHWRGQITFAELFDMYRRDREKHPKDWVTRP